MSEPNPPVEVRPLGQGRYEVIDGTRRRLAWAVTANGGTWVFLDGQSHLIGGTAPRGRRPSAHREDDVALAAPMPATVVSVHVAPGQTVARGDVLISLEAMKMELAITAPRDATVRTIACRAGELVPPGIPLLELE